MKRCVKITITGTVQNDAYKNFAQKKAQDLNIEGTVQNAESGSIILYLCGLAESLDMFIDHLYEGTSGIDIKDLVVEPFINEKNFRGVFRIIG